jgi:hypothetical protein
MRVSVINPGLPSLKLAVVEDGQGVVSPSPAQTEPQVLVVAAREDLETARESTRAPRRDPIGASNPSPPTCRAHAFFTAEAPSASAHHLDSTPLPRCCGPPTVRVASSGPDRRCNAFCSPPPRPV